MTSCGLSGTQVPWVFEWFDGHFQVPKFSGCSNGLIATIAISMKNLSHFSPLHPLPPPPLPISNDGKKTRIVRVYQRASYTSL